MTKDINWEVIHYRYRNGETAYAISKSYDGKPTKMGIAKRAKKEGWERISEATKQAANNLPIVRRAKGVALSKRTTENISIILDAVEGGASPKIAADLAGINPKTLGRWRKEDPQLDLEIRARQAQNSAENIGTIKDAAQKDWKAAAWIVERDPYSRKEYGKQRDDNGQMQIILNIHRDEVSVDNTGNVIDSVAVEEHEESLPEPSKNEATETAVESQVEPAQIVDSPNPPRDPEGATERDRREKERMDKCMMGPDWREKQAMDEHRAREERLALGIKSR